MTSEMQKEQPPYKRPNRVVKNCNDGKNPSEFTSLADEMSSYIAYQLKLLWSGDGETIEFTAKVDLDHYCKLQRWDLDTAVALSLGQSAKKVRRYWHRFSTEFKHQYQCRKESLEQAILHNFIVSEQAQYKSIFFMKSRPVVKPIHFLKWAKKEDWELYFDMDESIKKHHVDEDIDFRIRCKELELENRELREQVNLGARESKDDGYINPKRHSSYKKLIAGLLRLAFPNVNEINAHNVANKLSNISFLFPMLDEETIRDLIKEPRGLLNIKPHSRTNNVAKK